MVFIKSAQIFMLWHILWQTYTLFLRFEDSGVFFLAKHPKNLDPSYKMDLDLRDCL